MALGKKPLQIVEEGEYPLLAKADHWERVPLAHIAKVQNGFAFSSSQFTKDDGLPLIRIRDIDSNITENKYKGEFDNEYIVTKGDILVGMDGDFHAAKWRGPKGLLNQRVCRIIPTSSHFNENFLFVCLQPYLNAINAETSSVTVKHLSSRTLEEIPLPCPPLPEQRRIVEKIEALFSELDKGVEQLKTAAQQLKVYRQSVLKWAFEGKLTAEWRRNVILSGTKWSEESEYRMVAESGASYGTKDESDSSSRQTATGLRMTSARELLDRIKQEREALAQTTGKRLKPIPPLTEKELAELPELPEGWAWVRMGNLIEDPKYGTSKKCNYGTIGRGVLRIPNIVDGVVNDSDLKFAEFDEREIETYRLKEGDLLTIRSNGSVDIVGKCALITKRDEEYLFAGYLIRLRPFRYAVDPKYLLGSLSSHELRNQIESKAKSTSGVNNINSDELTSLIIPVCSLEEQHQIVQEIESRLSVCDKLEETITASLQQAEALRQSILKKAFEGKLVEQDPNDPPASQLLEQIKRQKQEDNTGIAKRTKKATSAGR